MQQFPELKNNQVALLRADAQTGRVIDEQLDLVVNDEQNVYAIFNSYYEALERAKSIMAEEKNTECIIYGKNQEVLFTFSPELKESFNEDFCTELEYHLCRTFENSNEDEIKWLWCDGVLMPSDKNQLAMKNILGTERILTEAWIGTDGQGRYEMTINLGENALESFRKGLSLIDCVPGEESLDWITIDTEKRTIELRLM